MLKETPKNEGTKNQLTGRGTIASIGITKKQSSRAQKLADIDAIIQERKDAAHMAAKIEDNPLSKQGRPNLESQNKPCNTRFNNDAEYLARRIKRDAPAIHERMKAGVLNPVVSHSLPCNRVYHLPLSSVLSVDCVTKAGKTSVLSIISYVMSFQSSPAPKCGCNLRISKQTL